MFGVEPTGKPISVEGIDHFVLRDGKVVSIYVGTDGMEFARQMGMMPPDGSAADKALKATFNAKTTPRAHGQALGSILRTCPVRARLRVRVIQIGSGPNGTRRHDRVLFSAATADSGIPGTLP